MLVDYLYVVVVEKGQTSSTMTDVSFRRIPKAAHRRWLNLNFVLCLNI